MQTDMLDESHKQPLPASQLLRGITHALGHRITHAILSQYNDCVFGVSEATSDHRGQPSWELHARVVPSGALFRSQAPIADVWWSFVG
jgi:hypothetical protein